VTAAIQEIEIVMIDKHRKNQISVRDGKSHRYLQFSAVILMLLFILSKESIGLPNLIRNPVPLSEEAEDFQN
jgi:hypothetical protein